MKNKNPPTWPIHVILAIVKFYFPPFVIFNSFRNLLIIIHLICFGNPNTNNIKTTELPPKIQLIKHPITVLGNITNNIIIRKTKRFAIPERSVYFLKTKRTAGGTPPPQNIFDRLTPVFT